MSTTEDEPRRGEKPSEDETDNDNVSSARRRMRFRTAQLPIASRILYRIEHYSSRAGVSVLIMVVLVLMVAAGAAAGFPGHWVTGFEVTLSAVTLVMVFVIQHTQGREQAATQRKLDELLKVTPGAEESLMMLEEAPQQFMLEVEEGHRDVRNDSQSDD